MNLSDEASRRECTTAAEILLLAVWIGLAAGFLDVTILVTKKRLIENDFIRVGADFPWVIPIGVATLVLLPGLVLALRARRRRGRASLGRAVWLLSIVGFLDVSAKLPLDFVSSVLLSAGLAVQTARLVNRRRHAFLRFARLTTPLLAAAVLALALATSGVRAWSEHRAVAALAPPPSGAPNVLLIVWDTVRAQNLSLYGHVRPTTPNLQQLAARGVWFRHAFSTSSWTLPSHASMFTGRWPHELSTGWKTPLDDREPTLAGRLGSLGYDTAGFVANLDYLGRETGIARGFSHFEDYPLTVREIFTRYIGLGRRVDHFSIAMLVDKFAGRVGGRQRPLMPIAREHSKSAPDIDRAFLDWLSWQRHRDRPFFAFLNYNDAHTPYEVPDDSTKGFGIRPESWHERLLLQKWIATDRPPTSQRDVQMANDLYDDCIAYLDQRLGALLDELGRRGVLDDTVVIVTSDHGEHLGDHRLFFHGCSLYRQLVNVPLVVAGPTRVPKRQVVDEPVSLRDVPATVLDLAGLARGDLLPGRSLARFWNQRDGAPQPVFEPLLMEMERPALLTNQGREPVSRGPMKSLVAGGMHYIRTGDGGEELFALGADPQELTSVAGLPGAEVSLEGFRGALRSMVGTRPRNDARTAGPLESPVRRQ
jgi:arylsulfatase A-like enzyme